MGSLFGGQRGRRGNHWYLYERWPVYECADTDLTVRQPKTVEKCTEGGEGGWGVKRQNVT